MAKDLMEKGAILQRDKETYAIAPHIAGGIIDPASLRKIAEVAEKYKAAALKITSAQRIAIVGLKPEDLDGAWTDLGMKPGAAIGLCVRSVKICPGTTFCKRGLQDSVGVGLKLDEKYHGMEMPSKFKIGVSGCPNSCAEPAVKDLGLMGTAKGWTVLVGGNAARKPRLGMVLAEALSDDEAFALVDKVINYYKANSEKKRLGEFIDEIGFENFKKAVL
ncbi:MAG: NAD(P)/FAD-dependent oxidoreductase [Methanothrix sp.]|jgi:NAD(P)H-nitrite reductase large subunit|uniref:Sulfite reductase, assimilatory-type n=1 Tax=Methanothrix harundinacea TaxID=301375 RepID=A0A101IG00_9EURY|nr:MAG: sulfite reductase [Methanosaeta sp. SDB]KUK43340.1 MAG: Sulfite reductase, assimilatory-type [Methanothrix harundinacea]MDD2639184.1 NAD(P)/FAD-dependent oxidoreductase [Methanothrix sp.]MDI9399281.1 NAD(P)/FAD-dependent oxidoreductase [Euryarchaeota archaeon]KUK94140.1 MAG: Sulfite reductase, assimilatory-type [Methanothrix harundinacea]